MKSNVIYFPFIRVPDSAWFTRMLLYWDSVSSIVPYDFLENPDRLGEHTRSLVEYELVKQIHPGEYVWDIPSFSDSFAEFLEGIQGELDARRIAFKKGYASLIHLEKMGPIVSVLCKAGLAELKSGPWFFVEKITAAEFMAYLASCLGRNERINATPVSDQQIHLLPFFNKKDETTHIDIELEDIRLVLLEDLFHAPQTSPSAKAIYGFRKKHGKELRAFRRLVEREILTIAGLGTKDLQRRRISLFKDEVRESADIISVRMREEGLGSTICSKLWSVVLEVPGIQPAAGLATAIANAFRGKRNETESVALAYASCAQIELLDNK